MRDLPLPPLGPELSHRGDHRNGQAQVGVERDGIKKVVGGFDVEIWGVSPDTYNLRKDRKLTQSKDTLSEPFSLSQPLAGGESSEGIDSLIVTLKTHSTVSALSSLRSRLSPSSVVTLLQNGMGVYDELCKHVWPDPASRPFFLLGTTTHGVTPTNESARVIHRSKIGEGEIRWGIVPNPAKGVDFENWIWGETVGKTPILAPPPSPRLPLPTPPSIPDINLEPLRQTLQTLLSLHDLSSTLLPMPHLHHQLLLKLALNSIINPLTAILGSGTLPNGLLGTSKPAQKLVSLLSAETSSILTAYVQNLSIPHATPSDVVRLFSEESLRYRTNALVRSTSGNISSMASDVGKGRITEIDYINGYLIQLGRKMGIDAPNHKMVRQMVKVKSEINGLNPLVAKVEERMKAGAKRIGGGRLLQPSGGTRKDAKRAAWEEKKRLKALALEEAGQSDKEAVNIPPASQDISAESSQDSSHTHDDMVKTPPISVEATL